MKSAILKSAASGLIGALALLTFYFAVITAISGGTFAARQFLTFWYFIVGLAIGFGIQVGLYVYLRNVIRSRDSSRGVLAASGTTSAVAMISCCAHYIANILPVIGAAGVIGLISQYQIQLFWVGLGFNLAGIIYIARKVIKFQHS